MLHIMKTKKNFVLDAIFCTVEGNTVSKHKAVILVFLIKASLPIFYWEHFGVMT